MIDMIVSTPRGRLGATVSGDRPGLVLLHAGVADRRSWRPVMELLEAPSLAFDRPGFGDTPACPGDDVDDLGQVLDAVHRDAAVIVGNSQGGRVALDFALAAPERVAALVLIAPAVSGAPEIDWEAEVGRPFVDAIAAAEAAGDVDAVNRLEALLWLDGPAGPEGRVSGATRHLFLAMNRIALLADPPTADEPPDTGSAFDRLGEIAAPVLVIVGTLDVPGVIARSRDVVRAVSSGALRQIPGVAHLPQMELPADLARMIGDWGARFLD